MVTIQIRVFLLLAVGFMIGKLGWMADKTRIQLTDIVIYIILPCTVISSFQTELTKDVLASTAQSGIDSARPGALQSAVKENSDDS